jgi:hypothetical protein
MRSCFFVCFVAWFFPFFLLAVYLSKQVGAIDGVVYLCGK